MGGSLLPASFWKPGRQLATDHSYPKDAVSNKHGLRSTWAIPLKTSEEGFYSSNKQNVNLATTRRVTKM